MAHSVGLYVAQNVRFSELTGRKMWMKSNLTHTVSGRHVTINDASMLSLELSHQNYRGIARFYCDSTTFSSYSPMISYVGNL